MMTQKAEVMRCDIHKISVRLAADDRAMMIERWSAMMMRWGHDGKKKKGVPIFREKNEVEPVEDTICDTHPSQSIIIDPDQAINLNHRLFILISSLV